MLFAALIFCSTVCLLCCASIDLVGGQAGVTGSSANRMKITLHNFLVGADHRRGVRGGCGQRRLQSQWRILVGPRQGYALAYPPPPRIDPVLDQPLPQPRRRWVRRIKNSVSGEAVIRLMCALVIGGCVDGHAAWACNVVAVHARAGTGPLAETNFARGGRRSPNRADIARHVAVSCCAHCVRAVHRMCCVGVSDLFLSVGYTYVFEACAS